MRNLVLVVLLAVAGATWWFVLRGGGSQVVTVEALRPSGSTALQAEPGIEATEEIAALPPGREEEAPIASSEARPAGSIPNALGGTIRDRFGLPVVGERVYLLRAEQGHPPAGAKLTEYVTAITGKTGRFSLTFREAGPWRLGVGPPGQPRIPPTEPRAFTSTTRADVVVPGPAAVRVSFENVKEDRGAISLEFLALNDPVVPRAGRRGERGGRNFSGDLGTEQGAGNRNRRGAGTQAAETVEGGTAEQSERGGRGVRAGGAPVEEGQGGGNRGGRGRDRSQRGSEDAVVPPVPTESWRTLYRLELTEEELAAGEVERSGLPDDGVVRLRLRVGRQRIEGTRRFSLRPNALTDIRILSVSTGDNPTLDYLTSLEVPRPGEVQPGVRWTD